MKLFFCILFLISINAYSQIQKAPERREGEGPWTQLIIRGVTLIDGTGAPAIGPVDIVIEKNKIISINDLTRSGDGLKLRKRETAKDLHLLQTAHCLLLIFLH